VRLGEENEWLVAVLALPSACIYIDRVRVHDTCYVKVIPDHNLDYDLDLGLQINP
jgi:hypothetical protein